MEYQQIFREQHDRVLLLALNRPYRLNAWTPQMMTELRHAIVSANEDATIGAIVLTGSGRGFCAGADISGEFAAQLETRDDTPATSPTSSEPSASSDWVALCRSSKPLLAAINGAAIGVGLTMVLPFDRLIATASAKLSARFVKMGLVPELASSHYLVARCGWGNASWMALSGATIDGAEAARIGLVDRVVDDGTVVEEAMKDAEILAANPGPQMRMIKELLTTNGAGVDLVDVQRKELQALEIAYRTSEHREAVSAFMEKRAPQF
jgi:enoyl-CoA hydratase/carnithine racemase